MAYQQGQNPGYYQPQGYNPYAGQPPGNPGWNANVEAGYPPQSGPGGMPKHDMGFTDRTIRAAFVRKVFTMVGIMLAVVAAMTAIPMFHAPTLLFIQKNSAMYFLGYIVFIVVYIALMCCEGVRRSFPANIICTAILTLSIGFMTMVMTARLAPESVLMCALITAICCGAIALFACQTKYDFTDCMGFMLVASLFVMIFGFIAIFATMIFKVKFLYTIYAGAAALLFMMYLAIDIQMIMGGRKMELSPEEHIFASIQLFLDVVYIFWMLLSLFGNNDD